MLYFILPVFTQKSKISKSNITADPQKLTTDSSKDLKEEDPIDPQPKEKMKEKKELIAVLPTDLKINQKVLLSSEWGPEESFWRGLDLWIIFR